MSSHRSLSIIGAPSSAGAYGPGQERAPGTFRHHGLIAHLRAVGLDVADHGDGSTTVWRTDESNPTACNADLVADVAAELADTVAAAMAADHNVLVLGGDCTVELGTVAGAIRDGSRVGLAYVDLDADLNTPETGDGILDWMGAAHLLDIPGAHPHLASISTTKPMLTPMSLRLFGTHSVSDPEQAVIDRLDLHVEPLEAVRGELAAVTERTREWAGHFDRVLVHVDADVLDFDQFPIAENTDSRSGLSLTELGDLLDVLCGLPNWAGLTVCEVNPAHSPDEEDSFRRLIATLGHALAPKEQASTQATHDGPPPPSHPNHEKNLEPVRASPRTHRRSRRLLVRLLHHDRAPLQHLRADASPEPLPSALGRRASLRSRGPPGR